MAESDEIGPQMTVASLATAIRMADAAYERVREEMALLRDALRIAHMHALQGGYGVEDGNDVQFVMDALSDSSGGEQ